MRKMVYTSVTSHPFAVAVDATIALFGSHPQIPSILGGEGEDDGLPCSS